MDRWCRDRLVYIPGVLPDLGRTEREGDIPGKTRTNWPQIKNRNRKQNVGSSFLLNLGWSWKKQNSHPVRESVGVCFFGFGQQAEG